MKLAVPQNPFVGPNSCNERITWDVYPFNKESISKNVPDDVTCGNYRLGELSRDNMFHVFYVGRVTKEKLIDRLIDHLNEFEKHQNVYFSYEVKNSEEEAYDQECKDFHDFKDDDGFWENGRHPESPSGQFLTCKICQNP